MRLFEVLLLLSSALLQIAEPRECATAQCCDEHRFCRFWASKGECTVNPDWMQKNCQMSCQRCQSTTPAAQNPFILHANNGIRRQPPQPSRDLPQGCSAVSTRLVDNRRVLAPEDMQTIWRTRPCSDVQQAPDCQTNLCFHLKFRSFDGTCNNLQRTLEGSAYTTYSRLLTAQYDDGVQAPNMQGRPSARSLVTFLLSNRAVIPLKANSLVMSFGQFLSHDITKNALQGQCACGDNSAQCLNIPIPGTDPRSRSVSCINFKRAIPACASQLGSIRQQINENTAFIDASTVYHSNARNAEGARIGAFMRTSVLGGMAFPPIFAQKQELDVGDSRNGIFTGLAMFHTTFVRLHNNIAGQLQNINTHWNQDRVFHETRKIVGAVTQAIVYQEFVPAILGPFFQRLVPQYRGYDSTVNPSILNEFSSAAFRLHGMIQEFYPLKDSGFRTVGNVPMQDTFQQVRRIIGGNFMDDLYRGLMQTPARSPQRITTFMTETFISSDMGSVNIQRGRDHGIRPYNDYRQLCNLSPLRSFDDWPEVKDQAVRNRIRELYNGNVGRIDLYVGGLVEDPVGNSVLGPTFSCIIAEQFTRLRDGDRFYFENPSIFSDEQREAIKQVTLAWVLCDTSATTFGQIPARAFSIDESGSQMSSCASLPKLNLQPWRE
ncbi:unnamed protein product, partial [Mesorhabditis belari]|uniref:peroxidase n=1 Tax=Mesorhabditis belari TaxID=2138241 RepID=A0AAF3EXW2_9BILA